MSSAARRTHNNAYCQDNEVSWIDWKLATSARRALNAFVARLAALRHRYPILRCNNFLHGKDEPAPGVLDIAWFDEQGQLIPPEAWNDPQRRSLVLRRAIKGQDGSVPILTCFFNPEGQDRTFKLPPPRLPTTLLLDSADPVAPERTIESEILTVKARSVVMTRSVHPDGVK